MCGQPGDLINWAPVASAGLAAVAAMIAAFNVWIQNRNARRGRSLDLLLKKEAEFETPRLRCVRKRAAKALMEDDMESPAIDDLLDFMESVSELVESGDLELEQAWATFHHWFSHYGQATKGIVETAQREDSEIWVEFSKILPHFEAIQLRRAQFSRRYSPEEKNRFLAREAQMVVAY